MSFNRSFVILYLPDKTMKHALEVFAAKGLAAFEWTSNKMTAIAMVHRPIHSNTCTALNQAEIKWTWQLIDIYVCSKTTVHSKYEILFFFHVSSSKNLLIGYDLICWVKLWNECQFCAEIVVRMQKAREAC